ncbi:futalosine hydrolase [Streptomyces poonensis]|uniref:Futalosine hydrolase n=1 Tax=Streptomyces poonensis TaxID=68255 RepID=A0A918PA48_9ACTN|nr:futalosine hydrolase [Streptomyces poonensis]GGY95148.1 Futalosine hydrolase [Streptomyces poonensis]
MVVQAQEGRLTTSAPAVHVLVATAVPVERDAVAQAFAASALEVPLPAAVLHRYDDRSAHGTAHGAQGPDGAPYVRYDLLAAGVGPARAAASTAAALTAAALAGTPYDLVVSAGIGGGFQPGAPLGSLVVADTVTAADLGAEAPDAPGGFLPVTELGFGVIHHRPPESLVRDVTAATEARAGTVLTVSTVTGSAARAAELTARHPRALAEGMEGFGVAEAAAAHGTPVLELRAVSNPVGPRDRAAWRIGDALAALTGAFGKLTPVLESWTPHDRAG